MSFFIGSPVQFTRKQALDKVFECLRSHAWGGFTQKQALGYKVYMYISQESGGVDIYATPSVI